MMTNETTLTNTETNGRAMTEPEMHELAVAVQVFLDHYRTNIGQDYIWSTVAKWSDENLWAILYCGESHEDPQGRINQAHAKMMRRWEEEENSAAN